MSIWKQPSVKRIRRVATFAVILAAAFYVAPLLTVIMLLCGALDVSRHRRIRYELIEKYFMGNGIATWMLSPVNLLADLLSYRNKGRFALADLPEEHRREIEACVRGFVESGDLIKAQIAKQIGPNKRCMLTFKWYGATQPTEIDVPAFRRDYRHIKTIAVSAFNTRERTSWHFGPLRLTFRVLYNLEPIDSDQVYIEVDDTVHYWKDNPLFIFDDTFFHRSINDVEHVRYCLFMDMVRPNYFERLFEIAVVAANGVAGSFKRIFYKNWSFVR